MEQIFNLKSLILEDIYKTISDSHDFDPTTVEHIVKLTLAQIYGGIGTAELKEKGNIEVMIPKKNGNISFQNFEISNDKRSIFMKALTKNILKEEILNKTENIHSLLKISKNLIYAKPINVNNNTILFEIYDINEHRISNTFGFTHHNKLLDIAYKENNLYIFKTQNRPKIIHKNAKYNLNIFNNDIDVLRTYFNTILKKLNKSSARKYSYKSFKFNKKRRTLIVILNNYNITKTAITHLKKEMKNYCNVSITFLTSKIIDQ